MQVSSKQFYRFQLENLARLKESTAGLQQQIATGKRLTKPSDDPVAATQATRLENRQATLEQYKRNMGAAQQRLDLEETVLGQSADISIRLQELVLQASTDTLSQPDRETVALEMEQLADQLATLGNVVDSNGEFIFGGFRSNQPPFTRNRDGSMEYHGDSGRREVEIADGIRLATGSTGAEVFMRVYRGEGKPAASVFDLVEKTVADLRAGKSVGDQVEEYRAISDHLTTYQTIAGSRLAKLQVQSETNDAAKLVADTGLSELTDTEMDKAIMDLKQQLLNVDASQASFAKIADSTLFNYMR